MYDVFISYRRDGGEFLALHMQQLLTERGYTSFYDIHTMQPGRFDEQIYTEIEQCNDVILILPPHAMDRCVNADDWLRAEILHALKHKKNIIPVMMKGFEDFPEDLPKEIDVVRYLQGVKIEADTFDSTMDKICSYLHTPLPPLICPKCGRETPADRSKRANICEFCGEAYRTDQAKIPQIKSISPHFTGMVDDFEFADGVLIRYHGKESCAVVPEGVTEIGKTAFIRCRSLKSIRLPNSVKKLGRGAFYDCTELTEMKIPYGVTSIGYFTFGECKNLVSISLPSSIEKIGVCAFTKCSSLNHLTLPLTVKTIEINAFDECKSLTRIVIPDCVTKIENGAFYRCASLGEVKLSAALQCIEYGAFARCSALRKVVLPDSLVQVERCAFEKCTSLTEVTGLNPNGYENEKGEHMTLEEAVRYVFPGTPFAAQYESENK